MEDDFSFASIWGAPATPSPIPSLSLALPPSDFPPSSSSSQGDDDFDDFGTARTGTSDVQDDDFGDFGDAGEMATPADFEDIGFSQDVRIAGSTIPESDWEPLKLDPLPSKADLQAQLDEVLGPIWTDDISEFTTEEDIREVEGVSQILVTPASRDLYNTLFHSPPPTKAPNWTRSRIRQQHLIALGIPINLDEVLPHASGRPLPPLQITTRPMSAPPSSRNTQQTNKTSASTNNSRSGTPVSANRSGPSTISQLGLGPKPQLDEAKVNGLLDLDQQTLPLLPLVTLERHLADIRSQMANTSTLLTHLLQTREALQQDSETYNGLIAELVNEAQKTKTGKGRQPSKRGSVM